MGLKPRRSGDRRLDRIEDKLDKEINASAAFRGELREFVKHSTSRSEAVNTKANEIGRACDVKTAAVAQDLQAHKDDKGAHGVGEEKIAKKEFDTKIMGWASVGAAALAAFGGIIGAAMHRLWSHAP